ncbi:helix-turn-helix domain-containing protein [Pseudomonas syringae pv. syringae]|nr:helix-turn-helix domain-containing protein [Pseudomonas syringae pv. syringae]
MDDAFLECIGRFKGEWNQELLGSCRLSEMGKYAPATLAIPSGSKGSAYGEALGALGTEWSQKLLETCRDPHLQPEMPQRLFNDGWHFKTVSRRCEKPISTLPIDWQLSNIDSWDNNFKCVLQNLYDRTGDTSEMCGTFEMARELIRFVRRFRPARTSTHPHYETLRDAQTRSQGDHYCELCWRLTNRSERWRELTSSIASHDQLARERIRAGRLSNRYCKVHAPGTARYHADLRYKAAYQHHLSVLVGSGRSDFAVNFQPPDAADMQELRKTAYDQVHSGLRAIASINGASLGQREKIWLMQSEGLSQAEMAKRLGVSRQAISKARKSLTALLDTYHAGCYLNPITGEAEVPGHIQDRIRDGLRSGLPIAAIAKEVGLSKGTVDGLARLVGDE